MRVKVEKRKAPGRAESQSIHLLRLYHKAKQKSTADKLAEIIRLVYEINPTATEQSITGNKPTVFFQFSGHVGDIEVSIYDNGWSMEEVHNYRRYRAKLSDKSKIDEIITELRRIKNV